MNRLFTFKKGILFLFVLLVLPFALSAEGVAETTDDITSSSTYAAYAGEKGITPTLVASTSWIASIVSLATDYPVTVLAPMTLKHPPEYDFTPQDIITAGKADMLFWGGYEGFMRQLFEANGTSENKIRKITTGNTPALIQQNLDRLGTFFQTEDVAAKGMEQVNTLFDHMRAHVASLSDDEKRVIVQFHQKAFIEALGYTVVAVIGPAELTVQDVQKIESLDFSLIVDNYHSPQALSFRNDERDYVELVNFPGPFTTDSLISVIEHNARELSILD